ncbi:hypothetical protein MBEHAL_1507 [Halarchaeum acidiphilum MH1-52-1]|uniref:Uncharacterized protein n=1 Tax=Halarchaeum acidiphilum MH1-52-1 TaxID=1261545 RepID=U2YVE9_9EURY|nr:hypothetical protein [Halarchaeum acidiphilum]GAD52747.1 hypothetical protein MBEHAL_1507 [Halarchaeum acidiphilum MH1-52-1]
MPPTSLTTSNAPANAAVAVVVALFATALYLLSVHRLRVAGLLFLGVSVLIYLRETYLVGR